MNSDLEIDFPQFLKTYKQAGELYTTLGETEFIQGVNNSKTMKIVQVSPTLKRVQFVLLYQRAKVVVIAKDEKLEKEAPISEFLKQIPSYIKSTQCGTLELACIKESDDADLLINLLTQKGYKKINKDQESKRDAFMRQALDNGATKQQFDQCQQAYNKQFESIAKVPHGKTDGYEKSVEDFKKESGYVNLQVLPIDMEVEIQKIWDAKAEVQVDLVKSVVFCEPQQLFACQKVKKVPKFQKDHKKEERK